MAGWDLSAGAFRISLRLAACISKTNKCGSGRAAWFESVEYLVRPHEASYQLLIPWGSNGLLSHWRLFTVEAGLYAMAARTSFLAVGDCAIGDLSRVRTRAYRGNAGAAARLSHAS
jgi:hypothetical protein